MNSTQDKCSVSRQLAIELHGNSWGPGQGTLCPQSLQGDRNKRNIFTVALYIFYSHTILIRLANTAISTDAISEINKYLCKSVLASKYSMCWSTHMLLV